jgi:Ca2+-binding RTX toxin-like protein
MIHSPFIETLETRRHFAISIVVEGMTLNVTGTAKNDVITIGRETFGSERLVVKVNKVSTIVGESEFSLAQLYGYGGNDNIRVEESNGKITSTIYIFAGSGDDTLSTAAGNDKIHGDSGNDTIYGGNGKDKLFGDSGDDVINGEGGRDTVYAGEGNDSVFGNKGDDYLFGEDGDDLVQGGPGNDDVNGGIGADTLNGGSGNDDFDLDVSDTTDYAVDSDAGDNQYGDADALV